jgi:uncharacterized coiled-coil DUF342 family protein
MNECNDPDHGAINAERSESRGLRKAWIELDDKRQQLERELTAVTEQRDAVTLRLGNTQERMFNAERQRDKLAEALRKIKNEGGRFNDPYDELDFIDWITYEALQSLNQSPNNA